MPGQDPDPREFLGAAYDRYAESLYRYALMLLADASAAEDVVHQAFVKLARMGRGADRIGSCGDYLRAAVRNECWRTIERQRRGPGQVDMAVAGPLLEAARPKEIDHDERARIEAALRMLPPEQREVIHLKVYEGQTFQQIADGLETSINTVASRYRYAMASLRKRLGGNEGAEGDSHER